MDKYDYVTATIEEEKVRLEDIIAYLEENDTNLLPEYKERYNNICKYLNAKERYKKVYEIINSYKEKLESLNNIKDEYEVDNILLEDTLLSKFHEDTLFKYRNLLYEDIKNEDEDIRDILYMLFEKESEYSRLNIKRDRLFNKIDKSKYPKTYDTLVSQDVLIKKQDSIFDDIFIASNNIKIEKDKIESICNSVMTIPILKILYEFWIVNSYDPKKVDKYKLFGDNKNLINIKNNIEEEKTTEINDNVATTIEDSFFANINLPGVNENTFVDINGKNYIKSDK